jgi:hypothetical protein
MGPTSVSVLRRSQPLAAAALLLLFGACSDEDGGTGGGGGQGGGGGAGAEHAATCADYCATAVPCMLEGDDCAANCVRNIEEPAVGCRPLMVAFIECLATMSCDDFLIDYDDPSFPCFETRQEILACDGSGR